MSSFGAQTTAAEVVEGLDLSGLRVVVTGAASGIGYETVRVLAGAGADVTLTARGIEQAQAAADSIRASSGGNVTGAVVDLTDLDSIAAFVSAWDGPLDVLVNNAGVMASPLVRTRYGWELQLATNHIGHHALANGLHGALRTAGTARIVAVSSVAHINGDIDLDDLNVERRAYDPWVAYSQSKTANILFALEAASRWERDGIIANSLHPGRIASTNLSRHLTPAPASFDPAGSTGVSVKDIPQGAATTVLLAVSPAIGTTSGRYFEDGQIAEPLRHGIRRGIAPYATNPRHAAALWEATDRLLAGRSS